MPGQRRKGSRGAKIVVVVAFVIVLLIGILQVWIAWPYL